MPLPLRLVYQSMAILIVTPALLLSLFLAVAVPISQLYKLASSLLGT